MAKINRFYTRADLGMARPRSVSRNITAGNGGVAVHYGGAAQRVFTEAQARSKWLAWQRFHMQTHGWADIAYTAGFDNWGNVYAGRGLGVRTAANGTNHANQNYVAFVWIGGGNEVPTKEAYEALNWLIQNARNNGVGLRVRPHSAFRSTACPGRLLISRASQLDNRRSLPEAEGGSAPETRNYITVGDKGSRVKEWQELLLKWNSDALPRFGADGDFGAETTTWTLRFYDATGLSASDRSAPRVGDGSFSAIRSAITPAVDVSELKAEVARRKRLHSDLVESAAGAEQNFKDAEAAYAAARKDAERAKATAMKARQLVSSAKSALDKAVAELKEAESKPVPEPEPTPPPEPAPEPETRNYITVGDKGSEVTSWQRDLRKWNPAALPRFGADGDFGNETLTWTLRFLDAVGLTVSDRKAPRVGKASRDAMVKALSFRFTHSTLIRQGDNGPAVREWQQALRRWSSNALPRFGADGDFGGETDDWTRRYQRAAGIGVDGVVGPASRSAMTRTLTS